MKLCMQNAFNGRTEISASHGVQTTDRSFGRAIITLVKVVWAKACWLVGLLSAIVRADLPRSIKRRAPSMPREREDLCVDV